LVKKIIPGETKEQRKSRKILEKDQKEKSYNNKKKIQENNIIEVVENNHNIAFVLGNGVSRSSIPPNLLSKYGKIYGCNALYREYRPDYLIAVDTKMIKEITEAGYHRNNEVWTNPNRYTREIQGLNLFNPNLGWSSGPSALNLASQHRYHTIYILGFDYEGIGKKSELVNNIYAGTHNYKKLNERATYFGNWTRQTSTCIKKNSKVKYIRVVESANSFVPDVLIGLPNLTHVTLESFKKKFGIE
jgi:hypothetical protein